MKKYFLILILISSNLFSQNIDSLYNVLLSTNIKNNNIASLESVSGNTPIKCGFGLRANIQQHLREFSVEQLDKIHEILERPDLPLSIVSPKGIFRLHYTDSGNDAPEYNIDDLAVAFDSAYNFEVNILGYPPHPDDGTLGGDGLYDIYVRNLSGGLYGQTTKEEAIDPDENRLKFYSYIEIDNSFRKNEGYNTFGIAAAKVTAAHEYHHAIQMGNYGFFDDDIYYHELTSTAFEEFVYDEVNDYYAYMNSYFRNTDKKIEDNSGYNLAILHIFLFEKYKSEDPVLGHKIVKKSWEYLEQNNRGIVALAKAMNDFGKSFANEFNTFGDWLLFTHTNSKNGQYFEESANYPLVRLTHNYDLDENQKTLNITSQPTSINYITFFDNSQIFIDTITAVISNSDVYAANNNSEISFTFSKGKFVGGTSINETYYSNITTSTDQYIQDSYVINGEISSRPIERTEIDFAYPQPFNYEEYLDISIPTHSDIAGRAILKIYSSDLNLVYEANKPILAIDNIIVKWDGKDNDGNKLASGVYVYVTKADSKIKKGKLVILN